MRCQLREILKYCISFQSLYYIGSNGASVMTGKYQIKMEIEIIGEFYGDPKTDHDNNMFMNQ